MLTLDISLTRRKVVLTYLPLKKTSSISFSSIDGLRGICLAPTAEEHDKLLERCTNRRNKPGREFSRGAIIWMGDQIFDRGLDRRREAQQILARYILGNYAKREETAAVFTCEIPDGIIVAFVAYSFYWLQLRIFEVTKPWFPIPVFTVVLYGPGLCFVIRYHSALYGRWGRRYYYMYLCF